MDFLKDKKGLITKTWEHCKSLSRGGKKSSKPKTSMPRKSKSVNAVASSMLTAIAEENHAKSPKAPQGCFYVYVGPEKQRFAVKAKYANHALFKVLLEEAESEYGFHSDGPIVLPCSVAVFFKVLAEMDGDVELKRKCSFGRSRSYHLLSPARMVAMNNF